MRVTSAEDGSGQATSALAPLFFRRLIVAMLFLHQRWHRKALVAFQLSAFCLALLLEGFISLERSICPTLVILCAHCWNVSHKGNQNVSGVDVDDESHAGRGSKDTTFV